MSCRVRSTTEAGLRAAAHLPLGADQLIAPRDRLPVLGERMAASGLAFAFVAVVAAVVARRFARVAIERDDLGAQVGERLAVVGDDHEAAGSCAQQIAQACQAVAVQVVGRLVEQHHVVPGQRNRGQADPCRLAARQLGHRASQQAGFESKLTGRRGQPLLRVGATERQPALERVGVGGDRIEITLLQPLGPSAQPTGGLGDADCRQDRLPAAGPRIRCRTQVADRAQRTHRSRVRRFDAGQDPQ